MSFLLRYRLAAASVGRALAILLTVLAALTGAASAATLLDVRFGITSADKTRIVLDISGAADYDLAGDSAGAGSLIVTLKDVTPTARVKGAAGKGHVASYRLEPAGGATTLTFALGRTAKLDKAFVLDPRGDVAHHRLVIDLHSAPKGELIASLPKKYKDITAVIEANAAPERAPVAAPAAAPAIETPEPKRPAPRLAGADWPTIVIDPGHGGGDPGAEGQNGTREKTVTLAASLALADMLKAKGRYKIILTRADDTRLGAKQRYEAALKAKPDLFISVHADALDDKEVRGGSVYTLSEEGKERSAEEALTQDDFQVYDLKMSEVDPGLGGILYDVAQTATLTSSQKFAAMLANNLEGVTPMLKNSLRKKDLRVLLAPDVPAVLLELAFISNEKDEANLNSKKWREKTMRAVAASIDQYFDEKAKAAEASVAEPRQAG
ncbi:MAG: N-acetylmuramoyl-L-alanine amidase [Pseudomonadota bacterium]